MKFPRFYIFLTFLLFIACSDDNPVENIYDNYNGTWVWYKSIGGFGGETILPEEGEIVKRVYQNSEFFYSTRNNLLKMTARIKFERFRDEGDMIHYYDISGHNYPFNEIEMVKIYSETLQVWDGAIDGFTYYFKRVR